VVQATRCVIAALVAALLFLNLLTPGRATDDEFKTVFDSTTGIKLSLPLNILHEGHPTKFGRTWFSSDRSIDVDILDFPPGQTLEVLYTTLSARHRRILDKSEINENSFTLAGRDPDGSRFEIIARRAGGIIRGLSVVVVEKRKGQYERFLEQIIRGFDPFPSNDHGRRNMTADATGPEQTTHSSIVSPTAPSTHEKGKRITVVPSIGDFRNIGAVSLSPNGQLAAVTSEGGVQIWNIASGRLLRTLKYYAFFDVVMFTPDGSHIISAHKNGHIKLWDVATGENTATFHSNSPNQSNDDYERAIWSMSLDKNTGLLIAGDFAGNVTVWELSHTQQLRKFKLGTDSQVISVKFSRDATNFTAVSSNVAKTFEIKTGHLVNSFNLPKGYEFLDDNSVISDKRFFVRSSGANCEIPDLAIFSPTESNKLITVDRRPKCDRPKNTDEGDGNYGELSVFF
jgi:hypothetical protein